MHTEIVLYERTTGETLHELRNCVGLLCVLYEERLDVFVAIIDFVLELLDVSLLLLDHGYQLIMLVEELVAFVCEFLYVLSVLCGDGGGHIRKLF